MNVLLIGLVLTIIFFILLLLRVPIATAIVLASFAIIIILLNVNFALFVSSQKALTSLDSFTLLAVPFFILAGNIMNSGGIAQRLINFSQIIFGKIPGSLAITNVAGNAMFGSISGSGIAAASAIGGVMAPIQKKEGYDEGFSAAVNVASAPAGQLIPPTAAFIVFSLASGGVSVAALFLAGWIPGLLWALSCMVVAVIISKKRKYPVSKDKVTAKLVLKYFWEAFPSLALLLIIIGGIVLGVFTATEAAVVAVIYTLFLSCVVYRTLKFSELKLIFGESALMSASIMILVGASGVMGFVLSYTGIPEALSNAILSVSDNAIVILLLINIILLIVGTFMDMAPAVLIFTPILMPITTALGMDPIQFGVMLVCNLAIGTITPPVGTVMFVGAQTAKINVERVIKNLVPFYIAIIVVLLFVTFYPPLSLWLPTALGMI
ncbi:MAG: TRAP transporter large permease [Mycoplasmatales bacterium]